jgi:hypothetical protein
MACKQNVWNFVYCRWIAFDLTRFEWWNWNKTEGKNWKKKREKKTKYILKSRKFRLGSPRIESKFSKLNAKNEGKETNPDKEQTILEAAKKMVSSIFTTILIS